MRMTDDERDEQSKRGAREFPVVDLCANVVRRLSDKR